MKNQLHFFSCRSNATHVYRRRLLRYWAAWDSDSVIRHCSSVDDILLPSKKAQIVLKNSPKPVDIGCMALLSNTGRAVLVLLPSGFGKSTVGFQASGIVTNSDHGESLNITAIPNSPYKLFCADMSWISVVDGKLCLCRPQCERAILAWDMARLMARRKLGSRRFQSEKSLPFSKRTQTQLFKRICLPSCFSAFTSKDICYPDVIVIQNNELTAANAKGKSTKLTKTEILERELYGQAVQKSKFWEGSKELKCRLTELMKTIKIFPEIKCIDIHKKRNALDETLKSEIL